MYKMKQVTIYKAFICKTHLRSEKFRKKEKTKCRLTVNYLYIDVHNLEITFSLSLL